MMAVKNRNPVFVIVLSIITLGVYAIYWFYQTRKELYEITKKDGNALVDLLICVIPFAYLWIMWKYSEDAAIASKGTQSGPVLFLLWLVVFPVAQYLVQTEINKYASA